MYCFGFSRLKNPNSLHHLLEKTAGEIVVEGRLEGGLEADLDGPLDADIDGPPDADIDVPPDGGLETNLVPSATEASPLPSKDLPNTFFGSVSPSLASPVPSPSRPASPGSRLLPLPPSPQPPPFSLVVSHSRPDGRQLPLPLHEPQVSSRYSFDVPVWPRPSQVAQSIRRVF